VSLLPSQLRVIRYSDSAMAAAIRMLEERGVNEDVIASELEPAIDSGLQLQEHVLLGPQQCWRWSVPGNVSGQWLAAGGPFTPLANGPTLNSLMLQDSVVLDWLGRTPLDCTGYFERLAQLELQFGYELRAVNVPNWPEVMEAAADEGRSRVAELQGTPVIPWWVLLAGGYLVARELRGWVK